MERRHARTVEEREENRAAHSNLHISKSRWHVCRKLKTHIKFWLRVTRTVLKSKFAGSIRLDFTARLQCSSNQSTVLLLKGQTERQRNKTRVWNRQTHLNSCCLSTSELVYSERTVFKNVPVNTAHLRTEGAKWISILQHIQKIFQKRSVA